MATILLRNPKILIALIALTILFFLGVAGGALGDQFGGGFLGTPMAHIQIPAESVSQDPLFSMPVIGDFYITNTMVATWLTIIILLIVSFAATRHVQEIPGKLQGLVEIILEFFINLAEKVAGTDNAPRFFPLVMTIFLFVVTANWIGILPGFGTIGRIESADTIIDHSQEKDGHHAKEFVVFDGDGIISVLSPGSIGTSITAQEYKTSGVPEGKRAGLLVPFLRSANTDVNTTLAIALIAMIMVHCWALRSLGVIGHIGKFINFKEGPIGFFVGLLEAIGELARVISFTFRLFGNIFAGEVLLIAIAFLVPLVGLIPFLGLELFVGLIQAFIFAMLTLVFAATASIGHDTESH